MDTIPRPGGPGSAGQEGAAIGRVAAVHGATAVVELVAAGDRADAVLVGDLLAVPTAAGRSFGLVHGMRAGRRAEDRPALDVQLLGELADGAAGGPRFRRGLSACPALAAPVARATPDEAALVYAPPDGGVGVGVGGAPYLVVGRLRQRAGLEARLATDALLGRHFAVLGSSGSGKSCAVAVILQAVLRAHPFAHVLVIDPHDEYAAALGPAALRLDPGNLELPYWLLTFEEIAAILAPGEDARAQAQAAILREAILRAKLLHADAGAGAADAARLTVDTPVPYRLSELAAGVEAAMGTLNKPEGAAAYRNLLARIAAVRDDRRYAFMFQSLVLRDQLDAILGRLLRVPVGTRPVTLLDVSGVPSEVVNVVVSVLCRVIFEFALWTEPERRPPVLLVCEEAHRYVPGDGGGGGAVAFEPTRRAIDRIAKEGRKYGVSLCLVSQRPAELSPGSLSQCGTILALRLTNERDLAFVRDALPDGFAWLARDLPGLATGEAVAVGQAVRLPLQLRFAELPPDRRPASRTPSFSAAWGRDTDDPDLLARTVRRWRQQQR